MSFFAAMVQARLPDFKLVFLEDATEFKASAAEGMKR
jgi:hypothetical protein